MKYGLAIAALVAVAAAQAPTKVLKPRQTQVCGQWDSVETGSYIVYNNLWGMASGTGSQCTTVNPLSGSNLSWSVSWSWSGGQGQVKSYPNVVLRTAVTRLSSISSIPSSWSWSYTGSSIVANVAYDLFTSSSSGGSTEYEIMIWLAALGGAGPISSTGSPVASPSISGATWNLFTGNNGAMRVFSFVATSQQRAYSGDVYDFVRYLINNQGLPSSQYLLSIGAGTEPFTGSNAVFSVSRYSCAVSGGGTNPTPTTTRPPTTTSPHPTTTGGGGGQQTQYGQCGGNGWTGPTACVPPYACSSSNPWYSQCV